MRHRQAVLSVLRRPTAILRREQPRSCQKPKKFRTVTSQHGLRDDEQIRSRPAQRACGNQQAGRGGGIEPAGARKQLPVLSVVMAGRAWAVRPSGSTGILPSKCLGEGCNRQPLWVSSLPEYGQCLQNEHCECQQKSIARPTDPSNRQSSRISVRRD
jgi:hypothetical protein